MNCLLKSYPQFARANGNALQYSFEPIVGSDQYLDHLQVDGSPQGYFQYVALSIVDDQYQLYWHGLYNDTTIVTSKEEARGLLQAAAQGLGASRDEASLKARNPFNALLSTIDSTPWVRISDGEAEVRLITFTKWGGFYEIRVTLSFDFPHAVLDSRSRLRFPYNCGVLY
jgi:hypothetical protein